MHTCIHNIHTYTHVCIHTCIHTYIHAYMHTYIHAYIHTYEREGERHTHTTIQHNNMFYFLSRPLNPVGLPGGTSPTHRLLQTIPRDESVAFDFGSVPGSWEMVTWRFRHPLLCIRQRLQCSWGPPHQGACSTNKLRKSLSQCFGLKEASLLLLGPRKCFCFMPWTPVPKHFSPKSKNSKPIIPNTSQVKIRWMAGTSWMRCLVTWRIIEDKFQSLRFKLRALDIVCARFQT